MSTEAIREAVKDAAGCLKGAQYLIERAYPEGDAPNGLLPALVVAVAICLPANADKRGDDANN